MKLVPTVTSSKSCLHLINEIGANCHKLKIMSPPNYLGPLGIFLVPSRSITRNGNSPVTVYEHSSPCRQSLLSLLSVLQQCPRVCLWSYQVEQGAWPVVFFSVLYLCNAIVKSSFVSTTTAIFFFLKKNGRSIKCEEFWCYSTSGAHLTCVVRFGFFCFFGEHVV